jgi:diacylglycerol kinase (ATP)
VGVPDDPHLAAVAICAALRDGRAHRFDLARTEDALGERRWFCAVLAAGFDALVNERANRMRRPKGPRRYDLAILLELARLRARGYTVHVDDVEHSFPSEIVAVGNCASYGGGMRILPDADPADGLLDVLFAAPLGRVRLARLKPRLRHGTHVSDPKVTVLRARRVRVEAEGIIGYADGERLGPLPIEVTCVPGAVRLLR